MPVNTTTSAGLSAEIKEFYDRTLLERALPNLVFVKYGQKRPIPKGNGKTIEFRKFNSLKPATTPLTEGTPPTAKDLSVSCKYKLIRVEKNDADIYTISGRFTCLSNVDKMTLVQFCMKKNMENINK